MKIIDSYIVKIPSYALPYLINGDDSGLRDGETSGIGAWYDTFAAVAESKGCSMVICPISDEYFTATPCFGLPCDVMDCNIIFLGV